MVQGEHIVSPSLANTGTSEQIRIAFVITELEPGGAERCLVDLVTRLDRTRYAPVVYSLGPRPSRPFLVERLEATAIQTNFLNLQRPWHYFTGVRRLILLLREQHPEIVQTFLFHANILGARAARAAGVPHLVTGVRVADPRRWRTTMERWTTASADAIVCVSEAVADFCRRRGFAAKKLAVIPNGIDIARWRNALPVDLAQFGVPAGRRVFVYIGRLDDQKGLVDFFGQLELLFGELDEAGATQYDFLVVGEGKLESQLRQLAAGIGKGGQKRIHFAGWRTDIPGILAAADLLILPSWWEGMPNVVLEAMAAGKPVVATRAHGVSQLLGSDADAQTVPIGRFVEIRRKVLALLSKPGTAIELGVNNQTRAAQEFSLDFVCRKYERLYENLTDR